MSKFKLAMMLFLLLPVGLHAQTAEDCDFNGSGKVDFADFLLFANAYGTNQKQFDLTGDDTVGFRDFIIFAQFYGDTANTIPIGIQLGNRAPDFTLQTLNAEDFTLYDQRGKPVFINFWATWCGPCIVEMPDMQRLQETMGDQILILGVDLREPVSTVRSFVQNRGFTWTFVLDTRGSVSSTYGVSGIPTSYFLDAKGVIVRKYVGTQKYETFLEAAQHALNN